MNLLLLLNNDIHAAKVLRSLEDLLAQHQVRIVLSHQVGKAQNLPAELVLMKEKEQFDIAKNFSYSCFSYENINSDEAIKEVREFCPDLILSVRFGQILQPQIISLPRFGVVNLHSGILPKYRGVLASFWSILHREKNLGCTLHYIENSGIDNGRIISFSRSEIDYNASLLTNISKLYDGGAELILNFFNQLNSKQEISTTAQEKLGCSSYFSYPKESDIAKFLELMSLT